jgi:hypothetical protein
MTVRVDIRTDYPLVYGKALYRRNEFGLSYNTSEAPEELTRKDLSLTIDRQFGIGSGNVLVMADTFAIAFTANERRFVSLDAYTNHERWTRATKTKPSPGDTGALVLSQPLDDRTSLDVVPVYSFNEHESTLYVNLGAKASRYFKVGQDLVGLASMTLVEIVLTDLHFEG